ncbi:MAG: tRNA (guanine37-N1)-methyltransferase [Methanosaeta sp. NSM2]|nr:class I SAM-dependent methyltransferase family protein [Methanothrix sp.]OYV14987.1 MAG: tRNA (guanine37-N1)-methyltransferase [Methanosaeta sp. NSM2]
MAEKSLGLQVRREFGERMRKALVECGLLDRSRKIRADEAHIYLPVLQMDPAAEEKFLLIAAYEKVQIDFQTEERAITPEDILGYRPSFEMVGDIALVEEADAEAVAEALMATSKGIKAVIAPVSDVEGEFRTRRFRHVAGEVRTSTIHKEHGLRYKVDLEGAYFTERLGTERLRVSRLVRPGDYVLDMFAGVGPFSLLLARGGAHVAAMDKNPLAVRCLRENAILNKIKDMEILEGDAAELALGFEGQADHVIMNLPHSASSFLVPAIRAAKSGGVVHYYCIAPEDDLYRDEALIRKAAESLEAGVEVLYRGIVRSYAPRRHNVVIDFRVKKHI